MLSDEGHEIGVGAQLSMAVLPVSFLAVDAAVFGHFALGAFFASSSSTASAVLTFLLFGRRG